MFGSIDIPFGSVMLFNVVELKPGVNMDDVEMAMGEMCSVVKETYGNERGGFLCGQVFKNAGFISTEGSFLPDTGDTTKKQAGDLVIVTYWQTFEQHEQSHADAVFKEKFTNLIAYCNQTWEVGYEMLWQGGID